MRWRQCSSRASWLHAKGAPKWVRCDRPHRHKGVHSAHVEGLGWKWWKRKNAPPPWFAGLFS